METSLYTNKIFHDSSVKDFWERLKVWINQRNTRFFYFGSYVYDINGNLYEGYKTHNWLDENKASLTKSEQDQIDIIKSEFNSSDFMSSITITQIIQQQYLKKQDQILHLSYDCGNKICELIPVDIDKYNSLSSTVEEQINDSKLEDEELNIRDEIIKSFDLHFELIHKSCTHIYFFPTNLRFLNDMKVINVSTFISPIVLNNDTVYYIQGGLTYCSERLISDTIQYLSNQAKDKAIKSAKAAIMSRNMSHNLGSHVMSYLKQHLSSVNDIVSDGILSDLIDGESKLIEKHNSTIENTTLPFLMGLGHFISYLQERQDFIATIATDYIPYFGNVNFKDSIYDELNPDKRAIRHSDRKNGLTDNILLGNIARSDGLGRQTAPTQLDSTKIPLNDIVLRYKTKFDGNPVVRLDDNGRVVATINEDALKELDDMRRKDLSLPGGIVGRQAFFSIMENIIRNAAKHGSWRAKKKLELTFDFFSCKKEDLERLEAFKDDNVDEHCLSLKEVITKYYLNAVDAKDLYFVTITDNCTVVTDVEGHCPLETLGILRSALMSKYIKESGEMDETSKGLKEMRISAAWMRAIHDESECFKPYSAKAKTAHLDYDKPAKYHKIWEPEIDPEKKAPLIYVRISAKKNKRGLTATNLQYIICVQIPRKVAIVLKDNEGLSTIKTNLERINWRAYNKQDFLRERNKSFEFILIDDTNCENPEELYDEVRCLSTARTFRLSEITGLNCVSFLQNIKASNYNGENDLELFYKELSKYKDERIVVDDKIVFERKEDKDEKIDVQDGYAGNGPVYIYRRHHEADVEFTSFMKSGLSAFFVEGITGNNSTDRLIRNEKLNTMWFYRHLHAMKQTIAIFDERLFQKMTGLEEKDLIDKENEGLKRCKDNMALAFLQKGVYPFTLVEDQNNRYKLKGIIFDGARPRIDIVTIKEHPTTPTKRYYCQCATLATLSFQDGKLHIDPADGSGYMNNHFDFMTIHQGLLDKLYKSFNIKKEDSNAKEAVTKGLFEKYSNQNELSNQFLPGMIIHSGRSKPNKEEMPQRFPFIQYAALDHAVMDCKYSLVELLDFARYEE